MVNGYEENQQRNTKKDKRREKKKHPYKKGGLARSMNIKPYEH